MAVSVSSIVGFISPVCPSRYSKYYQFTRTNAGASSLKASHFTFPLVTNGLKRYKKSEIWGFQLLGASSDHVAVNTPDKGSKDNEGSVSNEGSAAINVLTDSPLKDSQTENGSETKLVQNPDISNGSAPASDLKEILPSMNVKPSLKRSPLTAREKLRAAKVLGRYTESNTSKRELGSKVLEALRESDRGKKRSGLPEAPTNLFDDSKRGLPKPGLTFELPGGVDVFIIIFSFVFISTVMFATTYIVWRSGAIHFNEY